MRSISGLGKMLCCLLAVCILSGSNNFVFANEYHSEAYAPVKISGVVTDENNRPLVGASVVIKKPIRVLRPMQVVVLPWK